MSNIKIKQVTGLQAALDAAGGGSAPPAPEVFNGTGAQTAFALTATPASANEFQVYISGVFQPQSNYSFASNTITFSTAPVSGTANVVVVFVGLTGATGAAGSGGGGSMVLLATASAANSTSIDFNSTHFDNTLYESYMFIYSRIVPTIDSSDLWGRYSINGGSSYVITTTVGARYNYAGHTIRSNIGAISAFVGGGVNKIKLLIACGSSATESNNGQMFLYNAGDTLSKQADFSGQTNNGGASANSLIHYGGGQFDTPSPIDGFRFLMSTGNINSGEIRMYGITKA